MKNSIIKLVVSILICQTAGFTGSIFTQMSVNTWYQTINKPAFNPPNSIFPIVWTTLFILMGISLFLVWNEKFDDTEKKKAYYLFGLQLFVNVLWSLSFFGLRAPFLALIVLIGLWFLILLNITSFYKINKISGYLLIPYILWVSFAGVLNTYLWILNV
ncbi:TspO/MBR family protein [Elusimicrobiota bacterium]